MISPSILLKPDRIVNPTGWIEHIPFAFWIIEAIKPAVFVELGTHSGNSYFAFCQGVESNHLPSRCYAVDTWQDDEHAGFYDDSIFNEVLAHNEKRYSAFSSLLRMTFDEAQHQFNDASIDLLHIDGLHTYESVKNDFETWLPKLSARGVVLFHDVNVKERDFGVWKFWEEIAIHYPHLAFDHSHGLGVLLVGNEQSSAINEIINKFDSLSGQHLFKSLFARLGHIIKLEYDLNIISHLASDRNTYIEDLSQIIAERDQQIASLSLGLAERDQQIASLSLALTERDQQIGLLNTMLHDQTQKSAKFEHNIDKLLHSSSWRMTKPVRKITHSVRKRSRKVRYFFLSPLSRLGMIKDVLITKLGDKNIIAMEAQGVFNAGWYGNEPLAHIDRYRHIEVLDADSSIANAAWSKYTHDTASIESKYLNNQPQFVHCVFKKFISFEILDQELALRRPAAVPDSSGNPGFSIVTSFYGSLDFFKQTARSVAMINIEWKTGDVEWIINNDDPGISNKELLSRIPSKIRAYVHIIGGVENLGVTEGLNNAIEAAEKDWVLFLDSDDLLFPDVIDVLRHYIRKFSKCRYISSAMVDIDEKNNILRYRRHIHNAAELYSKVMIAGHLKAIRRDVFDEIGLLDHAYDTAQDYEFALRLAEKEPLMLIPEYLYSYRWHPKTQSTSNRIRQDLAYVNIISDYIPRLLQISDRDNSARASKIIHHSLPLRRGATIIRTQGKRLELLAETIASVEAQQFLLTPIVVVHGDNEQFALVNKVCTSTNAIVLHADDVSRLRGYPCNVGLDYVKEHADEFDIVGFLDDDDIYYPNYAERMVHALEISGADLVYAEANRREPWLEHTAGHGLLPSSCLVTGNFIVINGFALRVNALLQSRVRFEEKMEYFEDWNFLISLLGAGVIFSPLFEAVTEFRIFSDGNTAQKRFPALSRECTDRCLSNGIAAARSLGLSHFYTSLTTFDFNARNPLEPQEDDQILRARKVFEAAWLSQKGKQEKYYG